MSWVDRVLQRFGYAKAAEPTGKRNGGWSGAIHSRLTSDWITMASGPNAELYGAMRTLRDRARDLEKNNALVRRYLSLVSENVIGHKGVKLQAKNMLGKLPHRSANDAIEKAFKGWAAPGNYSADGRMGMAAFQQAVMRGVARDGEAFVRIVRSTDYGYSLVQIDPELVDETFNKAADNTGAAIKLGVEFNQWGRPLAYHVLDGHANDLTGTSAGRTRTRIPADEMLHLYIPRRPGQVRGESWLAPVMFLLKQIDGYVEAETVASRAGALKMGFILNDAEAGNPSDPDAAPREFEASAGVIEELDPGQTFQSWDPSHPQQNFALFVTQVGKFIAAGLNVSFASLTTDLREVNFSSSRIGLMQERDGWRVLQNWFGEHFCEPLYAGWLRNAWTKGYVNLRMTPEEYGAHAWQFRGWPYTNPQQEMMADMMAVAAGFTSPQRVVADNGDDLEEIYAEIEAAKAMAEAHGVPMYVPNSLVVSDGNDDGADASDADADDGSGSGGTSGAGRGGRAHSRVTLIRAAR